MDQAGKAFNSAMKYSSTHSRAACMAVWGSGTRHFRSIMKFAGVGSIGTSLHFAVLYVLVGVMSPVIASTLGATAGCLLNYTLSRKLVFQDRKELSFPLPKFVAVAALNIGLNAALMWALIPHAPVFVSQLLATGTVFLSGYTMNNLWSFREYQA